MVKFLISFAIVYLLFRLVRSLDIYQVIETSSNNILKYGNYYECKQFCNGFHGAAEQLGNNLSCMIVFRYKKKKI